MGESDSFMDGERERSYSEAEPESEVYQTPHDRLPPPELVQLALWWDPNEVPPKYPIVSRR